MFHNGRYIFMMMGELHCRALFLGNCMHILPFGTSGLFTYRHKHLKSSIVECLSRKLCRITALRVNSPCRTTVYQPLIQITHTKGNMENMDFTLISEHVHVRNSAALSDILCADWAVPEWCSVPQEGSPLWCWASEHNCFRLQMRSLRQQFTQKPPAPSKPWSPLLRWILLLSDLDRTGV